MGNYELDVAIEDPAFPEEMARQYESDLERATKINLMPPNRVRRAEGGARRRHGTRCTGAPPRAR